MIGLCSPPNREKLVQIRLKLTENLHHWTPLTSSVSSPALEQVNDDRTHMFGWTLPFSIDLFAVCVTWSLWTFMGHLTLLNIHPKSSDSKQASDTQGKHWHIHLFKERLSGDATGLGVLHVQINRHNADESADKCRWKQTGAQTRRPNGRVSQLASCSGSQRQHPLMRRTALILSTAFMNLAPSKGCGGPIAS